MKKIFFIYLYVNNIIKYILIINRIKEDKILLLMNKLKMKINDII